MIHFYKIQVTYMLQPQPLEALIRLRLRGGSVTIAPHGEACTPTPLTVR